MADAKAEVMILSSLRVQAGDCAHPKQTVSTEKLQSVIDLAIKMNIAADDKGLQSAQNLMKKVKIRDKLRDAIKGEEIKVIEELIGQAKAEKLADEEIVKPAERRVKELGARAALAAGERGKRSLVPC